MNYILVENRQIVHLGPISWRPNYIQSELQSLDIVHPLPATESGYIRINDSFELIPITSEDCPQIDTNFEQYAGPFYEYKDTEVHMYYDVLTLPIENIKNNLKNIIASDRYNKEISGTTVTVAGNEIQVDTSREARVNYVQKYTSMTDNESINWKTGPFSWVTMTKTDLSALIRLVDVFVQKQFDREKTLVDMIDATTEVTTLKEIQNVSKE